MFDVSGLTEVKMKKMRGWQGSYYVDRNHKCVAKTCYDCKKTLHVSEFLACSSNKYGLKSQCNECARVHKNQRRAKKVGDSTVGQIENRDYKRKLSQRTIGEIEETRNRLRPNGFKKCRHCLIDLQFDNFYPDNYALDGLYSVCKPCSVKSAIARYTKAYVNYWRSNGIPIECYVCGDEWAHVDHVIPLVLNGDDSPENMLPACANHNLQKNRHPLRDWLSSTYPDIADEVIARVLSYGVSIT